MFDFDVKPNFSVQNEAAISTRARGDFRYLDAGAIGDAGRRLRPRPPRRRRRTENATMKAALAPGWRVLLAGPAPAAHAQIPLPQFEARVTDLTGTLTAAQQSALEDKLAAFEARKGAQIAVLILPTTEPEDIAQFGMRLPSPGSSAARASMTAPSSSSPRTTARMRIEVRYGLEGALTDATQQPHHQRHHRAAVQAGRFLRRHQRRARPDDAASSTASRCRRRIRHGSAIRRAASPWPMLIFGAGRSSAFLAPLIGRGAGSGRHRAWSAAASSGWLTSRHAAWRLARSSGFSAGRCCGASAAWAEAAAAAACFATSARGGFGGFGGGFGGGGGGFGGGWAAVSEAAVPPAAGS